MGTGFDMALDDELVGVIPRAVSQIFNGIEERRREAIERNEPPPQYELTAQFLEVSAIGLYVHTYHVFYSAYHCIYTIFM